MKARQFGFVVLFFTLGCTHNPLQNEPTLVLRNVTLIDGISDTPVAGQMVLIREDRIQAIVATDDRPLPREAVVYDLQGATVLPGLINGHVHLTPNQRRKEALQAMLRFGVTTVRDLGGNGGVLAPLAASDKPLPTVLFSATMFGSGFMQDGRVKLASAPFAPGAAPWMRRIDDQTDLTKVVTAARKSGASGLKLYASLTKDQVVGLTAAAHAQGLKVWSHSVLFPATPDSIVDAGVDQLIHSKGLVALVAPGVPDTFAAGIRRWTPTIDFASIDPSSPAFQALFQAMVATKVILEPALIADGDTKIARGMTLAPWQSAQRSWACAVTAAAARAGVTISAGTDAFGLPGLLVLEMRRLHQCGVSKAAVIKAATSVNARALGIDADVGTLVAGKKADILVVQGSPLTDLSVLRKPYLVLKNGKVVVDRSATTSTR